MTLSRRNFLKASAMTGVAATLAMPRVHAAEDNEIKVGLIGCGGRGRGAANNTLNADPNCKIYALADAFEDKAKGAYEGLKAALEDRIDAEGRVFSGLDAYKDVVDCCDLVLL
ncbi:MAG: twin-arginine translocation signal domain-containing protein, partial [Thermoguttaceae bacterium]